MSRATGPSTSSLRSTRLHEYEHPCKAGRHECTRNLQGSLQSPNGDRGCEAPLHTGRRTAMGAFVVGPDLRDSGVVEDDSAPGTVFTTESDGATATWIVLERRDDGMRYARVAPDRIAGTIDVKCRPGMSPSETEVTVTYDVTSLSPHGHGVRQGARRLLRCVPQQLA
jgi:hypothetical protein